MTPSQNHLSWLTSSLLRAINRSSQIHWLHQITQAKKPHHNSHPPCQNISTYLITLTQKLSGASSSQCSNKLRTQCSPVVTHLLLVISTSQLISSTAISITHIPHCFSKFAQTLKTVPILDSAPKMKFLNWYSGLMVRNLLDQTNFARIKGTISYYHLSKLFNLSIQTSSSLNYGVVATKLFKFPRGRSTKTRKYRNFYPSTLKEASPKGTLSYLIFSNHQILNM